MDRITEAERRLHQAESNVNAIDAEMTRVRELVEKGILSQAETVRLEYVLRSAQAEWNLAVRELEILNDIR